LNAILVTPTGDRPEAFALTERWMRRQTAWDRVRRWIVVDDGRGPPTPMTLGQEFVRREPRADDPPITATLNHLAICDRLAGVGPDDAVFFIEDDDWRHPEYLERMLEQFSCGADAGLVGEGQARYYNVRDRTYMLCKNRSHASLTQTAIRGSMLEHWQAVLRSIRNTDDPFSDVHLWRKWIGPKSLLLDQPHPLCVGIKGMPGRAGIGRGHRPGLHQTPDPTLQVLGAWIGDEDLEAYRPFCGPGAGGARGRKAALLCPGPSLAAFPGRNGYDVVLGVNRAARRVPCDYWVFLDAHVPRDFGPPAGRPTLVSRACALRRVTRGLAAGQAKWAEGLEHFPLEDLPKPASWPSKWDNLSLLAALALAVHLGAVEIECWGVDWDGVRDWDGYSDARQNRTETRWSRERDLFNAIVVGLAAKGIRVSRRGQPIEVPEKEEDSCAAHC
jgi:hypothetical protein